MALDDCDGVAGFDEASEQRTGSLAGSQDDVVVACHGVSLAVPDTPANGAG